MKVLDSLSRTAGSLVFQRCRYFAKPYGFTEHSLRNILWIVKRKLTGLKSEGWEILI
jgi:hypothetical protein